MARLVNELVDEFEGFGLEDSAAPSPSERSSTDSGPAGGAGVLQPRRNRLALPWKVIAPGALDEDNEIVADGARCIMDSLGRVVATFHPTDLPFELERMAAHRIVECVNGGAQ